MTVPGAGGLQPAPLNAPPGVQVGPGVQPGVTQPVVIANIVIVFGPAGKVSGVFVYRQGTTPGPGNPPQYSVTNSTTDPYGNTVEDGFAAYLGAALIHLHINPAFGAPALDTISGAATASQQPAYYTLVANPGAANEYIATILAGASSTFDDLSMQIELGSSNADGSDLPASIIIFSVVHAVTAAIAYWFTTGLVAADPATGRPETWHTLTLAAGWTQNPSNPVRYRLMPDGTVAFTGQATHAAFSVTTVLSAAPLPAAYWPAVAQDVPPSFVNSVGSTQGVNVTAAGVVQVRANSSSTTTVAVQGSYPLN